MTEYDERAIERALGALEGRMEAMEFRLSRHEDSMSVALFGIGSKLDNIEAAFAEDRGRREARATLLRNLQWLWGALGGGAVVAWLWQLARR
jgi:hypothetical protein